MRQILVTLFAFYLMTIVLIPCADACNSHEHETPTTVQTAQDHHEHENDLCSPFCICSCCGSSITHAQFFAAMTGLVPTVAQKFPVHASRFVPEVYFNIWQPPKIS